MLRLFVLLMLVLLFVLVIVIPYAKSEVISTDRNQMNFKRVFDETKVNPW